MWQAELCQGKVLCMHLESVYAFLRGPSRQIMHKEQIFYVMTGGMRKNTRNIFQKSSVFLMGDPQCGDWAGTVGFSCLCGLCENGIVSSNMLH